MEIGRDDRWPGKWLERKLGGALFQGRARLSSFVSTVSFSLKETVETKGSGTGVRLEGGTLPRNRRQPGVITPFWEKPPAAPETKRGRGQRIGWPLRLGKRRKAVYALGAASAASPGVAFFNSSVRRRTR